MSKNNKNIDRTYSYSTKDDFATTFVSEKIDIQANSVQLSADISGYKQTKVNVKTTEQNPLGEKNIICTEYQYILRRTTADISRYKRT